MKTIYLVAALLVSELTAQAQSTPAAPTQNGTNAAALPQPNVPPINIGPPTNQNPVVTQSPINQATVDVRDQTATDNKVQRAVTGTGSIQVPQNAKSQPSAKSSKAAAKTKSSSKQRAVKSSGSNVTTQPTTPPRP